MKLVSLFHRRGMGAPVLVGAAVLCGVALAGGLPRAAALDARSGVSAAAAPAVAPLATMSYTDAVARVAPAVVTIEVEKAAEASPAAAMPDGQFFQRFFGPDMPDTPQPRNGRQRSAPVERGLGRASSSPPTAIS